MKQLKLIVSLSLIFFIFAGSIPRISAVSMAAASRDEISSEQELNEADQAKEGLQFRLSQGVGQSENQVPVKPAETSRLSESEVQNVLKRLPPVKAAEGDEQDFAMRDRSLPPPRTGKTVNVSFPSSEAQPTPDPKAAAPLEVLRFAPEGEIPLAPQLSITFSQQWSP